MENKNVDKDSYIGCAYGFLIIGIFAMAVAFMTGLVDGGFGDGIVLLACAFILIGVPCFAVYAGINLHFVINETSEQNDRQLDNDKTNRRE